MTIEGFFVKINLRKKGGFFTAPKKPLISEHLNEIGKNLIYCYLNMIILC